MNAKEAYLLYRDSSQNLFMEMAHSGLFGIFCDMFFIDK